MTEHPQNMNLFLPKWFLLACFAPFLNRRLAVLTSQPCSSSHFVVTMSRPFWTSKATSWGEEKDCGGDAP